MWHKIKHLFGWNTGRVVSAIDEQGKVGTAFQCDECGAITGSHIALLKEGE